MSRRAPSGTRVLLFTGKGGVGKTTVAAATALRCADAGLSTMVISTDPAHSLADAFDTGLGPVAAPVTDRLWGQQLDAQARLEESWGDIRAYLMDVFDWAGVDAIEAEELAVLPGLDEVFGLADIKAYASSPDWDLLVVDCAPTAETIRLLSLPDILAWYMERVFPLGRRINAVMAPVLSRLTSLPVARDNVFAATRRFYERLDGVREILTDAATTSVRLVVNPERVVIAEARRTYTYLSLFGYHVDAVIANRLLPDAVQDPWFDRWKALQVGHLATIDEGFAPLPVLRADLAAGELVGLDALRAFGTSIYGEADPATRLHDGEPPRIRRVAATMGAATMGAGDGDGGYALTLALPFAERDELDLHRRDDELLISVGPYRRAMILPDSLRRRPVLEASLRDATLEVVFGARSPAGTHDPGGDG